MGKGRQAMPIIIAAVAVGTLRFAHPTKLFAEVNNAHHRFIDWSE